MNKITGIEKCWACGEIMFAVGPVDAANPDVPAAIGDPKLEQYGNEIYIICRKCNARHRTVKDHKGLRIAGLKE